MAYTVRGRIRRSDNSRGIAGLTIKAYDVDWISSDDYLGRDVTDANGNYSITFNRSDFDAGWFDLEGGPDLIIKVYNSSNVLVYKSGERSGAGSSTTIDVRLNPLDLLGEYTVSGKVQDPRSGRNLCNLKVKAYDDDFIFDDYLGQDRTNHNGDYLVPYKHSDFTGWENYPDPYVKIYNNDNRRLAKSFTRWNTSDHSSINVLLPAQEVDKRISECVYGWNARYRQEGTHIIVRIKLNPDSGISNETMTTLKNTWKTGIEDRWGNRFASKCPNCSNQHPLTFEVQWVNSNAHHNVRVRSGSNRSNMLTWDTMDTASVAAHEFGHMLGLVDEYSDGTCPDRSPVNTGTIMDNNTNVVERHVEHLARMLNEDAVPITAPPEKNAKKNLMAMKKVLEIADSEKFAMCRLPDLKARKTMKTSLASLVKGTKKPVASDKITHIISGGTEGKRVMSRMEIASDGLVSYTVDDQLKNLKKDYSSKLDVRTYKNLLAEITSSGLLDLKEAGGPFLPDSTVGTIILNIGGKETRYYYLADKEERRDQSAVMKQAIAAVDSSVSRLATRTIKRDDNLQLRIKEVLKPVPVTKPKAKSKTKPKRSGNK